MKIRDPRAIVVLLAVMTLLTSSCVLGRPPVRVGETRSRSQSIALDGAKSERVEIEMAAGELHVSGGASELLQAKFTYNVAELDPQVAHRNGTLSVRAPTVRTGIASLTNLGDYRYVWDLRLNDHVPMQMRVEMGAGSAVLKLGSLSLTRLDLEAGVGPVTLDLTGNPKKDLDAKIDGGVGGLTLLLPSSACARVHVDSGVGRVHAQGLKKDGSRYVSDGCEQSRLTLRIDISAGVGDINLEVGD
jgi:hypothetical protein